MPELAVDDRLTLSYRQVGEGPDLVWISGGGGSGDEWHQYQVPFFTDSFRNTTFDNRGIGETRCSKELPWSMADFATDAAALIEAVCEPPVTAIGLSMGSLIVLQLGLDRPDLLRCGVAMGTAASGGRGWVGDYMRAEVELRKHGGKLEGMFAFTHYCAEFFPARALGDSQWWEQLKARFDLESFNENNEGSLIPQWQACIDFDVTNQLAEMTVPIHVFAFEEDVQAPPQYGEEVAALCPHAELHLFAGMGHVSLMGHTHSVVNPAIRDVVQNYI